MDWEIYNLRLYIEWVLTRFNVSVNMYTKTKEMVVVKMDHTKRLIMDKHLLDRICC